MELIIITVFFIGYACITCENYIKIDKMIIALLMTSILWSIIALSGFEVMESNTKLKTLEPINLETLLLYDLGKTSEILLFLIGSMTIVELIDFFGGFSIFQRAIKTTSKSRLLWVSSFLAFFLSSVLDNLTTTIIILTILNKLVSDQKLKTWYAGIIIISANAGGAWSPIGDITTTMLWIDKKINTFNLIKYIFLPSFICCFVTTWIVSKLQSFKGNITSKNQDIEQHYPGAKLMLIFGIGSIIFVPIFKIFTGLPPYLGMSFSLGLVSILAEILTRGQFHMTHVSKIKGHPLNHSLSRIEFSNILFFFGILMSVAALEALGTLFHFATYLDNNLPSKKLVIFLLGLASAIIDNVPLVAAGIDMFPEPSNHYVWYTLAYAAGTGGSILIIGSAAGVIAMGMEKIAFFDYFKKISLLAFIGYLLGFVLVLFHL